jgi:dCTP deaminase
VHPGFAGCLTLELSNVGEIPIAIKPGIPICQLFIHSTTQTDFVDKSLFVGHRRPTLGRIDLDDVARKLAKGQPL